METAALDRKHLGNTAEHDTGQEAVKLKQEVRETHTRTQREKSEGERQSEGVRERDSQIHN